MSRGAWRVAIVGVTGAVGRTMAACLAESAIPIASIRGFASERSNGTQLATPGPWGNTIDVELLALDRLLGSDLVLFSAGAEVSRRFVMEVARESIWAVDNSSAFRLDPEVPLVVPEVNPHTLPTGRGAVANPNCSTIEMVVAVAPLAQQFGLRRIHVATYQSVSGSGQKGIAQLRAERDGPTGLSSIYPHPIDGDLIPQCDLFLDDGFTREEEKMILETRRILERPDLPVHPTCVRVPVEVGHGEVIHLELERAASRGAIRSCLEEAEGLCVDDCPEKQSYPTPKQVAGRNEVVVGRIRSDRSDPRIVELWVVADNLRKGAAYNAIQIAECLYAREG